MNETQTPLAQRSGATSGELGMARARSTATKIVNEAALANPNDTHSDINPLLNAALDYALRGWRVLPCVPCGTVPLTAHGVHDATAEIAMILEWRARWPDAHVAVALGQASGIVVLDVDDSEALRDLEAEHGPRPKIVASTT